MNDVDQGLLVQLDELQNRYIAALDNKDMKGWAATFSEKDEASYICRSSENEAMGWPIALMLDDCRARIEDRILFVTQIWRGTFQDYRTRHFAQRLSCERISDDCYRMRSNFSIDYTFDPQASQILATGLYDDVIAIGSGGPRFLSRRAIYDTTVLPQYVVYPF